MLPKYLKVKGFRSYLDTTINFKDFGSMFVVLGENGAGKSSIIEMITTALYWINSCTDSKGVGMDDCINSDCDFFTIEFCFEMNGIEYIVKTTKHRGESRELEFYIDGVNQSEKVTETQQKINDVLKMNYDTFLDTICVGQGKSNRFMNKKPAERKETLMQILDVQKYETYEKIAKEKKKMLKTKIDGIEKEIEILEDRSSNDDVLIEQLESYKNELKTFQDEHKKIEQDLEIVLKEKTEYETKKKQIDNIKNTYLLSKQNLNDNKIELEEIEYKIKNNKYAPKNLDAEIQNLQLQVDTKHEEILKLKDDISSVKSKSAVIDSKLEDFQIKFDRLNNYDKHVCELCGNEISLEHKQRHLKEIKEQISNFKNEKEKINQQIHDLNIKGKETSATGKELSFQLKQKIFEAQQNEKYKSELQYLKTLKKDKILQNKSLQKQFDLNKEMFLSLDVLEERNFNDNELKYSLQDIDVKLNNYQDKISRIDETLKQHAKDNKLIKEYKTKLKTLKQEFTDYGSLVTAFGKSGIPASIIAHDIPEMEIETNNILKIISNGTLSIQYITEKKTSKAKKAVDTLDIVVYDKNGFRKYETYSGGEKFRIDFACHIGMAKFLTKRAGASIDFLIIDEGLGSQDDFSKQKFIESIHSLKGIFKQIMVITHIQDLQNAFDHKVLIEKDQLTGSKVEILS